MQTTSQSSTAAVTGYAEVRAVLVDPSFVVPPVPGGVPGYAEFQRLISLS